MKDFDKQARNEIIQEMSLSSLHQNTYIYKQGGIGNYFIILKILICYLFNIYYFIKN